MRGHSKAPSARSIGGHHRFGLALLASLALVLMCGFFASASQAATVYRFEGKEFGVPGSGAGEMPFPEGIAVDDQSGYALMASGVLHYLNVFKPNGSSATYVGRLAEDELVPPRALAIDQAKRVVYVVDNAHVVKYDISGSGSVKDPLAVTPDLSFTSFDAGTLYVRLAVDPTNGDLLAAERFGGVVNRYKSDGTFVSSFNGAGSAEGPFSEIRSLAVDATGSIYVVDVKSTLLYENPRSVVERFAADGTSDPSFTPDIQTPQTVAVDPSSGNVIVVGRTDGAGLAHPQDPLFPVRLYTLHGDQVIDELDFPADANGAEVVGLAIGGADSTRRLYATAGRNGYNDEVITGAYALKPFTVPDDVHLDPIGTVTPLTAQLSGSATPIEEASTYHFEYSREGGPVQSTETLPLGEGKDPVALSAELTDLIPNSEYEVRLVATTTATGVSVASQPQHFATPPAPPLAVTGDAIDRMNMSATLLGRVNPYGQQTHYRFEYGTTISYGQQQPADHDDVAGQGRDPEWAKAYLTNLEPGTEYHYRLVAENATGPSFGADRTFITLGPPDRYYEQITPVEKGGSEANGFRGFHATADGEGLMYQWKTAPQDGPAGPAQPHGFAWRSADAWSALALEPLQIAGTPVFGNVALSYVLGISEDGTKAIGVSLEALAPGAVEGNTNLYLIDTHTGAYTTMESFPGNELFPTIVGIGSSPIVDGTPDYSRVLLKASYIGLIEGAPFEAFYEWSEGDLHVASIAPDGTPLGFVPFLKAENSVPARNYMSDDGSKVFFYSYETGSSYVRIDDQETVQMGGELVGASSDGHYAFVFGTELTPDSEPGMSSLYRFDTETRQLELMTALKGEYESFLQVSSNGASVFFNSPLALAPGAHESAAARSRTNFYVWHEGEIQLIATENEGLAPTIPGGYIASPSGRYFAFTSYASLSDYDSRSKTACVEFSNGDFGSEKTGGVACPEVFRYDVEAQQLLCASCPRDGARPNGHARAVAPREGSYPLNRAMLDNGTVIFDTTQALSSRDVNSTQDVYTFDGSEQVLISAGENNVASQFDDASADGRDIFFTTTDRLVGQDTDSLADVYDARIGGGIPGQNPPPPRGECIRDDCKATPNQGPELPFGGSEGLNGTENVHEGNARKRCAKGSHARKVKGGKSRCVKQAKKHHKQAKNNRRQSR